MEQVEKFEYGFIDDATGTIYEQFRVHYNRDVPFRNRTEKDMCEWIIQQLEKPLAYTIDGLHALIVNTLEYYQDRNPGNGDITISEVSVFSRIAGKEHIVARGFGVYGPRRGTYTLLIREQLEKDSTKDYELTDSYRFQKLPRITL